MKITLWTHTKGKFAGKDEHGFDKTAHSTIEIGEGEGFKIKLFPLGMTLYFNLLIRRHFFWAATYRYKLAYGKDVTPKFRGFLTRKKFRQSIIKERK